MRAALLVMILGWTAVSLEAQGPRVPTFDVVSIRVSGGGALGSSTNVQRPDGGFTVTNTPVSILINRAYPGILPADMIGLPAWARSERYDVMTTSSLGRPATADERIAMLRAMLADRFALVARLEPRDVDVYDLVIARSDRRLGSGLMLADETVDCEARAAERAATPNPSPAAPPPDLTAPPPPCTIFTRGPQMEGNVTMAGLARFLGGTAGRFVVDKTGLSGMYRVVMEYDRLASVRGPAAADAPGAPPSVFTAVQEQLGLRLEPSRAVRDMLVIDRLEHPTEN
jgi:uncharacterized protein (TIGR03435 family)